MLLDVLNRIHADPLEYLGSRSLERLRAFEMGYGFFKSGKADYFKVEPALREWVLRTYQMSPDNMASLNAIGILQEIVLDEEQAFDLFFTHLASLLLACQEILLNPADRGNRGGKTPLPASGFLNTLTERPLAYLGRRNPRRLRAFLDGYRLACLDEGFLECRDLDGFEKWVGRKLRLRGGFRWENAVLERFQGQEKPAFEWCISKLKEHRASLGPLSERNHETVILK